MCISIFVFKASYFAPSWTMLSLRAFKLQWYIHNQEPSNRKLCLVVFSSFKSFLTKRHIFLVKILDLMKRLRFMASYSCKLIYNAEFFNFELYLILFSYQNKYIIFCLNFIKYDNMMVLDVKNRWSVKLSVHVSNKF